jgi:23S rRNA (guanosine2251-2'-O)-methyltransferase
MVQLILILDNLRSAHNVGAILRTADATGVDAVYCCGTTPYPRLAGDTRDPVVVKANMREISKTALGAETTVQVEHYDDTTAAIAAARAKGCSIYGLEQAPKSLNIMNFQPQLPAALIVGNEPHGITPDVLTVCDEVLEIPQRGTKESLNVSVATGIALYQLLPGETKT